MARSGTDEQSNEFAELVAKFRPDLVRMVRKRTGDAGLAEDVVQEALLKAYASFASFDRSRPPGPWLRSIAIRSCIDQYRRKQRRVAEVAFDDGAGCTHLSDPSDRAEVLAALRQIPERDVQLLFQHYVHGYSYEELAVQASSSTESLKSAAARARRRLRDALGGVAAWVAAPHARFRSSRAFATVAAPQSADLAALLAALMPIVLAQALWLTSPNPIEGTSRSSVEARAVSADQDPVPGPHDRFRALSSDSYARGSGDDRTSSIAPNGSASGSKEIASVGIDHLEPAGADAPETQTGVRVWWEDDGERSVVLEVVFQASRDLCRAGISCEANLPVGGPG